MVRSDRRCARSRSEACLSVGGDSGGRNTDETQLLDHLCCREEGCRAGLSVEVVFCSVESAYEP